MSSPALELHYAHADGHTSVCYSDDGKYLITCGSDGDARLFSISVDADEQLETIGDPTSECVGETALALCVHADHFYVGTDNNYVQAYSFPDIKRDGIVCRFTAPVTDIAVNEQGTRIAACSCDMDIQVASLNNTGDIIKMAGHTAPVTGIALDPQDNYLASSSCDGSVKIWNVSDGNLVKTLPNMVPTCNDFFRAIVLGRPSWQSKFGGFLAVPCGKEVLLYERDSWVQIMKLADTHIMSPLSLTKSSPSGLHLAAISTYGEVFIWDVNSQKTIASYHHPKRVAISGVAWHPEDNSLAICDRLGQYSIIKGVIGKPDEVEEDRSDMEDDENTISIQEIKKSSGWQSPKDDEDDGSATEDERLTIPEARVLHDIQAPFQPTSTPSHLQHRFMLWNSIGVIRCFNTEDEKSIDVEFHDSMVHHSIHLNNYEGFSMAALSLKVLALASPASDEEPSKLKCILLNSWDGSKEWSVSFPSEENIAAIAAEGDWVAVATNLNHLRIFSFAGTQRQPLAIPGPIVSLCGFQNKLCVVYHLGIGIMESQNLGVSIYEIVNILVRTAAATQPLPLSPKSTLKWCGFTDEGRLCSFDSEGLLRSHSLDAKHWLVLSDTKLHVKGTSDQYFIIGISEKYQNIRCVLCKGCFYPMVTPRPTVVEIPFRMPLCEPDSEKSKMEEMLWILLHCLPSLQVLSSKSAESHLEMNDMEKRLKQILLKLFAATCSSMDIRANELATLMPEATLEMAARYASKSGKIKLAEKLNELAPVDWSEVWTQAVSQSRQLVITNSIIQNGHDSQKDLQPSSQVDMFASCSGNDNQLLIERPNNGVHRRSNTSSEYVNPFQKKEEASGGPRGLNFFDSLSAQKSIKPESFRSPGIVKLKSTKRRSNTGSGTKFVDWFNERKTQLTQQYPDLDSSQLTKKAMTLFRDEQSSLIKTGNVTEDTSTENLVNPAIKRKSDQPDATCNGAKKVSAGNLSAFMFKSSKS